MMNNNRMITIYSQLDKRWCNDTIGKTKITIGKMGCTLTSIAMLSTYFNEGVTPDVIASFNKLFNAKAEIIWGELAKVATKFKFDWRAYKINAAEMKKIKQYLADPNKAVILQVNHGAHWVVAVKPTADGKSFSVIDPWGGVRIPDVLKKYGNITGAAYFSKK